MTTDQYRRSAAAERLREVLALPEVVQAIAIIKEVIEPKDHPMIPPNSTGFETWAAHQFSYIAGFNRAFRFLHLMAYVPKPKEDPIEDAITRERNEFAIQQALLNINPAEHAEYRKKLEERIYGRRPQS